MSKCPVCNNPVPEIERDRTLHCYYIDCKQCGNFSPSYLALPAIEEAVKEDSQNRQILSYAIKQKQLDTKCPEINEHDIPMLLETKLPSLQEQMQNLLLLIKENINAPGALYSIDSNVDAIRIGAMTPGTLEQIIRHLSAEGLIEGTYSIPPGSRLKGDFTLTVKGWKESESILIGQTDLKRAFMAMDFNNPDIGKVYEEIYKPLCQELGYFLSTVSKKAGIIDITIREQIKDSKFLIADLTDDNLGAYWESGFAEGFGLPVIYCCEKTKFEEMKTHFDTNHLLTACWLIEDESYTIKELKDIIIATFPNDT